MSAHGLWRMEVDKQVRGDGLNAYNRCLIIPPGLEESAVYRPAVPPSDSSRFFSTESFANLHSAAAFHLSHSKNLASSIHCSKAIFKMDWPLLVTQWFHLQAFHVKQFSCR